MLVHVATLMMVDRLGRHPRVAIVSYSSPQPCHLERSAHNVAACELRNSVFRRGEHNHANYARLHGYPVFSTRDCVSPAMEQALALVHPASWRKVFLLQMCIKRHPQTWFFWVDTDALFVNPRESVESRLLAHLPANCSLALAADGNGDGVTKGSDDGSGKGPLLFNAGVILVRGDQRGSALLKKLGSRANGPDRFSSTWEQQALHALWREDEQVRNAIHIIRPRTQLQSFLKVEGEVDANAYLVHLTLCISQRNGARKKRPCVAETPALLNRTARDEEGWFSRRGYG